MVVGCLLLQKGQLVDGDGAFVAVAAPRVSIYLLLVSTTLFYYLLHPIIIMSYALPRVLFTASQAPSSHLSFNAPISAQLL